MLYYKGKMFYYTGKMRFTKRKNDTSEEKMLFSMTIYLHTVRRENENAAAKCFITAEKCISLKGKTIRQQEKCF
jgi:hypothetical protein